MQGYPDGFTWRDAILWCGDRDPDGVATLASVNSQEENDYIFSLIDDVVWLGGTDEAEEGVWRWGEFMQTHVHGTTKTLRLGCVNAARKARQKW